MQLLSFINKILKQRIKMRREVSIITPDHLKPALLRFAVLKEFMEMGILLKNIE